MDTWVSLAMGLGAMCFFIILIFAPSEVRKTMVWGCIRHPSPAFSLALSAVAILCLVVQAIVWTATGSVRLCGVPPIMFFALYSFFAFSIRGVLIWLQGSR
jgi:hypothetical protein